MKPAFSTLATATLTLLLFFTTNLTAQDTQIAEKDTSDIYDSLLLERITIVGNPAWMSQIPGAASYIDTEKLDQHSYTDINRVLRSISGVNIQEEDGFGLRPNIGLRGAGVERSSKINIMEDGVLIAPAPYSAPAAYYFPNVGRMSSVEVRKGSSQIKYGPNTTGGALNLISTRIPYDLSGKAEITLGENNANKLYGSIGNSSENFGFLLEGLQLRNDGFKELDGGGNTGFDITDLLAKVMIRTQPDAPVYQRLELKAGYYDEISDETYLGLTRDDFSTNPFRRYAASQSDRMEAEHTQMMARHFAQFSDNSDLTTTIYRNDFARNWYKLQSVDGTGIADVLANPNTHPQAMSYLRGETSPESALSVRANNREYFSQGVESIFTLSLGTDNLRNQFQLGVRLHQDEEDRFQFEDGYRMENGSMILTDAGTPGTQANRIGSATALSVYLQDTIHYGNWTATPGLRYENIWFENRNYGSADLDRTGSNLSQSDYTIQVLVPGIGLTYSFDERLTLITGVHKGFSPPSPGSNSSTRSEESINYELGVRFANSLIQTEVIGFYNDYSNLLGSDLEAGGGSGTSAQFNAGEVLAYGVEWAANLDLADLLETSFEMPLTLNYTFTRATFQSSFQSSFDPWGDVNSGDLLPFIPEHQLNASIGLHLDKLHLNLNSTTTGQMRTAAGSGSIQREQSTDSYLLLDGSASYQVASPLRMFVQVRNLLNETYIVSDRPAGVRPGLPRTLMAGVKIEL